MRHKLRYYWRKVCHFFGYCPRCHAKTIRTRNGRALCPECGQR